MQCLIPAAGLGSRLSARGPSKPLIEIAGRPLLAHVLDRLMLAGCDEFVVVTGHRAAEVEHFLERYSDDQGVTINTVHNPDFLTPNGLSVLSARDALKPVFLMSMCDHLFDPEIARNLARLPLAESEVVLAVDRRLDNPDVDMEDVTRVRTGNGLIDEIGKNIVPFDAFDTGLFLATGALLDAIKLAHKSGEEPSISAGMMRLAVDRKARVFDIGTRFWIDVDNQEMFEKAEAWLLN